MIPIRDTIRSQSYPVVNSILIVINVAVFLLEPKSAAELNRFVVTYGLVPVRFTVQTVADHFTLWEQAFSLISFMFLHGGFWHLLGNMWFLYIFGDNVEDTFGSFRYLLFYLLCGWASGLTHFIFNLHSPVPVIGASGAIAGVMGAYFILYPRARVLTLIPIIIIPYFIELPAAFFLGIWFVIQFISAALASGEVAGGIAWWAHVGGFVFGILFLKLFGLIPRAGVSQRLGKITAKKRTPRLQTTGLVRGASGDMYGTITITPQEAFQGTRKIVNIPVGFRKRLFRVAIPPGVENGTTLRLAGMGGALDKERKRDAFLKVMIK